MTAFDVDERASRCTLIVVRRDAAGFQHLHPTLGPDGAGGPRCVLPAPGVYRLFADFVPTGGPAAGAGHRPVRRRRVRADPVRAARVAQIDGYQVRLDGDLVPGAPSQVFATVSRDGVAVTDLQPYLGAFGHLVALRRSDLAYMHVHPDAAARPPPTAPGRASRSPPRCRPPAATGCSSTSGTAAWCTPPSSPSTPGRGRPIEHPSTDLTIGGMTCASCANRVERKLNQLDGVVATVNYATEKAHVSYSVALDPAALVAEVEAAGYTAALPQPDARAGSRPHPPAAQPAAGRRGCSRCR